MRFQAFYHLITRFEMVSEGCGMSGALTLGIQPVPKELLALSLQGPSRPYSFVLQFTDGVTLTRITGLQGVRLRCYIGAREALTPVFGIWRRPRRSTGTADECA